MPRDQPERVVRCEQVFTQPSLPLHRQRTLPDRAGLCVVALTPVQERQPRQDPGFGPVVGAVNGLQGALPEVPRPRVIALSVLFLPLEDQ